MSSLPFLSLLPPLVQRVCCSLYIYPALVVDFILSNLVQVVYIILSYPFVTPEQRADNCGHIFRYISYIFIDCLNPFWHCHVLNSFPRGMNREPNLPTKKIILMMNHISSADPFLTIRAFLPRDGSWIAKAVLFRVPFGGWSMANADDLPVHFLDKHKQRASEAGPKGVAAHQSGNPPQGGGGGRREGEEEEPASAFVNSFSLVAGTTGPMLERARAKLRRGRMLCVFPEGTRSGQPERRGYLEPFRQGFFDLALEEGAIIVPMAITGTDRAWPRGSLLMQPANCYFSYGDPIEARGYNSAVKLSTAVRQELLRLRESHPDRLGTGPL